MGVGPFGGGGPIRNLLAMLRPPVPDREAFASMVEFVPQSAEAEQAFRPVFHSLGGVKSARQDKKGSTVVPPPGRAMQDDPSGPDNVPARPYDGDGNTKQSDAKPEVVRGESQELPSPDPASPPSQLRSPHAARLQAALAERQRLSDMLPHSKSMVEYNATLVKKAEVERDINYLRQRQDTEQQEYDQSPEGFADKINRAAAAAMVNGDWTTHALMYKQMLAARNPRDGSQDDPMFLETAAREAAAPHVLGRAADVYERFGKLENLPGNEYASLMRGLRHVFPMTPAVAKTPREVQKWWLRVRDTLDNQYNPSKDPAQTAYWGSVATAIRDHYTGPINSGK